MVSFYARVSELQLWSELWFESPCPLWLLESMFKACSRRHKLSTSFWCQFVCQKVWRELGSFSISHLRPWDLTVSAKWYIIPSSDFGGMHKSDRRTDPLRRYGDIVAIADVDKACSRPTLALLVGWMVLAYCELLNHTVQVIFGLAVYRRCWFLVIRTLCPM